MADIRIPIASILDPHSGVKMISSSGNDITETTIERLKYS
jgi:hypothetical protein